MSNKEEMAELATAKPYIRTGIALLCCLLGGEDPEDSYKLADKFIERLEEDVKSRT